MTNANILLVDDEPNVLDGLKRVLGKEFSIETSASGEAGLDLLAQSNPFAVVMSDMRMPGMNGVQFLTAVRGRWPDTVRLMLTGNADIQTAIEAVNEGCVFRFLTKPCPENMIKSALRAALSQYELITAEKELLEKTLHGSIKVLTDILALVNPAAFSRASRIHHTVKHMVQHLGLSDGWRYEVAAMLSQIGCVAFDSETVEAVYAGVELPAAELERFKMHPSIAFELLSRVPRLEMVAAMIAGQRGQPPGKGRQPLSASTEPSELGALLLKIAVDFDQFLLHGMAAKEALGKLKGRPEEYYAAAVAALETLSNESVPFVTQEISIREMSIGMILDEDLRSSNGILMVARNQEISYPLLVRIRNLHQKSPIPGNIRVKVPQRVIHPSLEVQDRPVVQSRR
jgi:response regulator RpfG family c-di-GMP phosphodiesterase